MTSHEAKTVTRGMGWAKKVRGFLLYCAYLLVVTIVLFEIIFRVLPTMDVFELMPTRSEAEILRFEPSRELSTSLGWYFYQTARKSTNNYGFVTSQDYEKASRPDIVIIGDSFVEALQVENAESVGEVMQALDDSLTVYQLGIAGVHLSQYLKMLEYAEAEFSPKEYIIVIVDEAHRIARKRGRNVMGIIKEMIDDIKKDQP